jgi:hypothetical protein
MMPRVFGVFALTVCCICAHPVGAAITLVENGTSAYEILLSTDALPITIRAAQDLQLYIEKGTGAHLPIRQADSIGTRPAIIVGDGPLARALGVTLGQVKPEGFRIKTVGENLIISGQDTPGSASSVHWRSAPQAGTWHGISHFLEQEMGIRWFFPGKEGEYLPTGNSLNIREQDFTDAPRMIYRRMTYLCDDKAPVERINEVNDWLRRNRSGWSIVWQASHSWREYFPSEKYFRDHPDWFALVDGRRVEYSPYGLQMCTTNSVALDEFVRVAIDYGNKNPGVMFSLSPNDGGNFCECDRCRALDHSKMPDGTPILTDRIVNYANEVAKRVTQVRPNQTFGLYAYGFYADPPLNVGVDPHIYIMGVDNAIGWAYYSDEYRRMHLEKRLLNWKSQTENLFFYSFPEGSGNMDLPSMHSSVIEALYRNLALSRVKGLDVCMVESFASSGLNHYLYLRMAWNPEADFGAIYEDAMEKCYGTDAMPFVQKYFDTVAQHVNRYTEKTLEGLMTGAQTDRRFPDKLQIAYEGLYEEGMPFLREALRQTLDSQQRRRVDMLLDNLEYTDRIVGLQKVASKILPSNNPERQDILTARDLCIWRDEELKSKDNTNLHQAKFVNKVAGNYNLRYDAELYNRVLLDLIGGRSKALVSRVATPPSIDGNLTDVVWQGLDALSIESHADNASAAELKTNARVTIDEGSIYISISLQVPFADASKGNVSESYVPDEIEIFFAPPNNEATTYWHLSVDNFGMVRGFIHAGAASSDWDSKIQLAIHKTRRFWTLEAAVPLSSFGIAAIIPGDVWRCNLCRVRGTGPQGERTCWSPTFGPIVQPHRFGYMIFR